MTVEEYLRAVIPGYPFETHVLKNAALSPMFAKNADVFPIELDYEVEEFGRDEGFRRSLKYATSTIYYSAAGAFSGGSRTEQVGDVRSSLSGFTITQADRAYYRSQGDRLRGELGEPIEESATEGSTAFDATSLRRTEPNRKRRWN